MPKNDGQRRDASHWRDEVYDSLKAAGVEIISYVPDAGHSRAIERAVEDAVRRGRLDDGQAGAMLAIYEESLGGYTYMGP